MKELKNVLFLMIAVLMLSSCSKQIPQDAYEKLITGLKKSAYEVQAEDVKENIYSGKKKWLTINNSDNISVYIYENKENMEKDASYISADGFTYDNGRQATITDWVSYPHFYKIDNIIVLYVGDNLEIIEVLEEILGSQFAGEIHNSIDGEPITMQHGFPLPIGIDPNLSQEQIEHAFEYWKYSDDWTIVMPAKNEDENLLRIGIGPLASPNLEIHYELIDRNKVQAEGPAAIDFVAAESLYYEGLTIVTLTGFRGDKPNESGLSVVQYIPTM